MTNPQAKTATDLTPSIIRGPALGGVLAFLLACAPLASGAAPCSYSVSAPPGYSMIANQCDAVAVGGNTLNNVLPSAPNGSQINKWNNTTQSWEPTATFNGASWSPNLTLNPGGGAFFWNPTATPVTLAFSGNLPTPVLPLSVPANGYCIVSRQTPQPGWWDEIVGAPPQDGDVIYRFDPVTQNYLDPYTYIDGFGWFNAAGANQQANVGESIWICRGASGSPPPVPQCIAPPFLGAGLVAWWPLDEGCTMATYADIAGGNTATIMSGPLCSANSPVPVAGKVAGASFFSDYLRYGFVPNPLALNVGQGSFSVDCWIKVSGPAPPFNPWQPIVDKLDVVGMAGYTVGIDSMGRVVLKVGDTSGIFTYMSASGNPVLGNTWSFVGVAFDRVTSRVRFHVNGVNDPPLTLTPLGNVDSTIDLRLGGAHGPPYAGEMALDEVEIFTNALATTEMDAIWNAGSAGKCKTNCLVSIRCEDVHDITTNLFCGTNCVVVTYPTPPASGNCPTINVVCTPPSGYCFTQGVTTVTCKATDGQGKMAQCTFTVTVLPAPDTTPPMLNCDCLRDLANHLLMTNGCPAYVPDLCQFTNCFSDNCCLPTNACVQMPAAGSPVGPGTHPITIKITDCAGNMTNCVVDFVVTGVCPTNCLVVTNEHVTCASNVPGKINYTFDLVNDTGVPIKYLFLVPKNNCFKFMPDLFTFPSPVLPGQSINISTMILLTGNCPPDLCFFIAAHGSNLVQCCSIMHCVTNLVCCGFLGSSVAVQLRYPTITSPGQLNGPTLVSASVEFPGLYCCPNPPGVWSFDVNNSTIDLYHLVNGNNLGPAAFSGFEFTFTGAPTIASVTVDAASTLPVTGVLFSGNTIAVNYAGQGIINVSFTRLNVTFICCIQPPTNMVLWLPLDETSGTTAQNLAGVNNGTHFNGPTYNPGSYVANSLCFDGVNDFVEVLNHPAIGFGTGDFSVDAWVKPATLDNTTRVIVDHRESSANGVIGHALFLANNNTINFQLADGTFFNYNSTFSVPADGQWHLVAVTVDRTGPIQFYYDGNPVGTPGNALLHPNSVTPAANFPLRVGARSFSPDGIFKGCIDEVELFNRELTAAEVAALYNAGSAGKCKPACTLALTISKVGGSVVISWLGNGVLQQANQVTGPWTDIPSATSPYTVPPPLSAAKYYRVRCNS